VREKAKKLWIVFQKAPSGKRFQSLHAAEEQTAGWTGVALTLLGLALVLFGIVLLFIPGPGILLIAFGAALVAQRFLWLAKRLDALELWTLKLARRMLRFWKAASTPVRAAVVAACIAIAAGAAYGAWALLLKK
jgi:type IV secretory pathway VirB3-like protein